MFEAPTRSRFIGCLQPSSWQMRCGSNISNTKNILQEQHFKKSLWVQHFKHEKYLSSATLQKIFVGPTFQQQKYFKMGRAVTTPRSTTSKSTASAPRSSRRGTAPSMTACRFSTLHSITFKKCIGRFSRSSRVGTFSVDILVARIAAHRQFHEAMCNHHRVV